MVGQPTQPENDQHDNEHLGKLSSVFSQFSCLPGVLPCLLCSPKNGAQMGIGH